MYERGGGQDKEHYKHIDQYLQLDTDESLATIQDLKDQDTELINCNDDNIIYDSECQKRTRNEIQLCDFLPIQLTTYDEEIKEVETKVETKEVTTDVSNDSYFSKLSQCAIM